jgi:CheY-like chemotaxis protein
MNLQNANGRDPTKPLKNRRIFLVEDDVSNLAIALALLQKAGATVGFSHWGGSTMSKLLLMAPLDIILLDLNLEHGVSGYDVFDNIRQEPQFADVPVIAVSAMDPSIAMPEVRKRGFSGFISKPIEFTLFAEQIATVIEGNEVWYAV